MKRVFLAMGAICFLSTIYSGCKKEAGSRIYSNQVLINNAEHFFKENILPDSIPAGSAEKTYQQNFTRKVLWDQASVTSLTNGKAVIVPINFGAEIFVRTNIPGNPVYPVNLLSKLLIYEDNGGNYHAEVVTGYPDSSFTASKKSFSGIATVETWKGELIHEYKYDQRGIKEYYKNVKENQKTITDNIQPNSRTKTDAVVIIETCYTRCYHNYSAEDPVGYSYCDDLGCTYEFNDIGGNYNAGPGAGDYGSVAGGGGTGGAPKTGKAVL